MSTTTINFKVDAKLKAEVQALADELGISLSSVLVNSLRKFADEKKVCFSKEEKLIPNARTRRELDQIKDDIKNNRNLSPTFASAKEAIEYLKNAA